MGRWLEFRHNTHQLVLFVLPCLQQVEKVITVSTKTCYDKYSKYVCVYYPFSCHSIPAMFKRFLRLYYMAVSICAARRLYAERFPMMRLPSHVRVNELMPGKVIRCQVLHPLHMVWVHAHVPHIGITSFESPTYGSCTGARSFFKQLQHTVLKRNTSHTARPPISSSGWSHASSFTHTGINSLKQNMRW